LALVVDPDAAAPGATDGGGVLAELFVGVNGFSFPLGAVVVVVVTVVLTPEADGLAVVEFADEPTTLLTPTVC
jgi:hypothetical protein